MTDAISLCATLRDPIRTWYRDPVSCLQACLAMVIEHAGHDPLETLGLAWEFNHIPGDVKREEFYFPCRFPGDPAHSISPYHDITSKWCAPADEDGLRYLSSMIGENRPVIAAVDNYYLPFRPAYHDVHAAHLVVVTGVDIEKAEVSVADPTPPSFDGTIAARDFLNAWGSANHADDQDVFFSSSPIGRRCLMVTPPEVVTPLDQARLHAALRNNISGMLAESTGTAWTGLDGLDRYLTRLTAQAADKDTEALADVYPFGWAMQAQAFMHAELLRACAVRWRRPVLGEAARRVASVSHAWTGLRVSAGHGGSDPTIADTVERHCRRLRRHYEQAVESLDEAAHEVFA